MRRRRNTGTDIRALRSLSEKQRATMVREHDIDILIPIRTHRNQIVAQYRVREGKMIGREIILYRTTRRNPPGRSCSALF